MRRDGNLAPRYLDQILSEGADWAKKKGLFKMWIEHVRRNGQALILAPRGLHCSEFLFAPEFEPCPFRRTCSVFHGVDPTFDCHFSTSDHPLYQIRYFFVHWCYLPNEHHCKNNGVKRPSGWWDTRFQPFTLEKNAKRVPKRVENKVPPNPVFSTPTNWAL